MRVKEFGQNELDCHLCFLLFAGNASALSMTTFYISDCSPCLLFGLAILPENESTKVQSDSSSAPIFFAALGRSFAIRGLIPALCDRLDIKMNFSDERP